MSLPQPITIPATMEEVCQTGKRWLVDGVVIQKIYMMAELLPFGLSIISGFRTREHQIALGESGRPAADPDVSTHCSCPATGADLRINGLSPGPYEKALFGEAATRVGLRWGGGSPAPEGIPTDWNHVDLGPRSS